MKIVISILAAGLFLFSCNDSNKDSKANSVAKTEKQDSVQQGYFPVTDFIKGQITEIKEKGLNPIKVVTANKKTDSGWVKIEQLDAEFAEFLNPVIDSANMSGLFRENSFMDQTINAITFTYDPIQALPDSVSLQRWDVYIDPQKRTVKRIYLVKKGTGNKTLQLTWQADKWSKIVTIANDAIEKEVTIKWDF